MGLLNIFYSYRMTISWGMKLQISWQTEKCTEHLYGNDYKDSTYDFDSGFLQDLHKIHSQNKTWIERIIYDYWVSIYSRQEIWEANAGDPLLISIHSQLVYRLTDLAIYIVSSNNIRTMAKNQTYHQDRSSCNPSLQGWSKWLRWNRGNLRRPWRAKSTTGLGGEG